MRVSALHLEALVAGAEAHQLHVLGEEPVRGGQHQVGALLEVQPTNEADQRHLRQATAGSCTKILRPEQQGK